MSPPIWTFESRAHYDRDHPSDPGDLIDEEGLWQSHSFQVPTEAAITEPVVESGAMSRPI